MSSGGHEAIDMYAGKPILEMRAISKRFDNTQALENVSLTLFPGEIHALLGENGAGRKSIPA